MELNNLQLRLMGVYKQLYQYKHLLKGAPVLSFDLAKMSDSDLKNVFLQADNELKAVAGYLLGIGAASSVAAMIDAVNKHYKQNDFWRNLLLDYIEIRQSEDETKVAEEKKARQEEGLSLYTKLREFQKRRKEIIDSFSQKISAEKFPVDATRLFKNYLNMADLDSEEAWRVLCTNPAFFSPLVVEDKNGKRVLSVNEAREVNKKMGDFIRKMKA